MSDYRPTVRTVLNRERLHEVDLGIAKGLELIAMEVLGRADPPDATTGYGYRGGVRYERRAGEGLVERGAFISYVDGKRVGGDARKKPKDLKVRGRGVSIGVGYGFPARFQEMGTVRQPARPFLTPAVMEVVGDRALVEDSIRSALSEHLRKKQRKIARRAKYGPQPNPALHGGWKKVSAPFDFGAFMQSQKGFVG